MVNEFEDHLGPLCKGDLIVIEIGGRIIPKGPDDPTPQWFVVLGEQAGNERIPLKPYKCATSLQKARKYKALWGG